MSQKREEFNMPTSQSSGPYEQQGPQESDEVRADRVAKLNDRVRLDLWKATWEASQVMSYDEIREHVEAIIREIESDEP